MLEYYRTKFVNIVFLVFVSMLWAFWSFKMDKNLFSGTKGGAGPSYHTGVLKHSGSGLLSAGVCPLGKLGAWVIFLWGVTMLVILGIKYKSNDKDKIRKINKIIGWINVAITGIIFIVSLLLNQPLFFRTLPFYLIQISISIVLLNDCNILK